MGQLSPINPTMLAPLPRDPAGMAEQVMCFKPANDAEALKLLRASFPDYPLSARVAALAFLMRRPSVHGKA